MLKFTIRLETIKQVKEFTKMITKVDADCDLYSGKKVVDAKSLLGIFSLNLLCPLVLEIHSEEDSLGREVEKSITELGIGVS